MTPHTGRLVNSSSSARSWGSAQAGGQFQLLLPIVQLYGRGLRRTSSVLSVASPKLVSGLVLPFTTIQILEEPGGHAA